MSYTHGRFINIFHVCYFILICWYTNIFSTHAARTHTLENGFIFSRARLGGYRIFGWFLHSYTTVVKKTGLVDHTLTQIYSINSIW